MSEFIGEMKRPFHEQTHRCPHCNKPMARIGKKITADRVEHYVYFCRNCLYFRFYDVSYPKVAKK